MKELTAGLREQKDRGRIDMRKIILKLIFASGVMILLGISLYLPKLMTAFLDNRLSKQVIQMENSNVSLTMSQDPDFMQRLVLFHNAMEQGGSVVEVGGQGTMTEEEVAAAAMEAMDGMFEALSFGEPSLMKSFLFLESEEEPQTKSGIFWYCVWEDTGTLLWLDDVTGAMIGLQIAGEVKSLINEETAVEKHKIKTKKNTNSSARTDAGIEEVTDASASYVIATRIGEYCRKHYPVDRVEWQADNTGTYRIVLTQGKGEGRTSVVLSVEWEKNDICFNFY